MHLATTQQQRPAAAAGRQTDGRHHASTIAHYTATVWTPAELRLSPFLHRTYDVKPEFHGSSFLVAAS